MLPGVPKPGGDISSPIIWLYTPNNLSMAFFSIPSNNLTMVCVWARVSTWIRGIKIVLFLMKCSGFGEDFFFGLHLICSPAKIVFEVHPRQCWKWSKIGVKLQIIPPKAQQRFAPLSVASNYWMKRIHNLMQILKQKQLIRFEEKLFFRNALTLPFHNSHASLNYLYNFTPSFI